VEELALRLQDEAEINPWLDSWHIPGGAQWEQEIEQALDSCGTCAVVLGEHGWGEYHLRESKAALARREDHPSFRVIPVFLSGAREEDTGELPDFFGETQWVDFRDSLDDSDVLARLITAIEGEAPYPEGRPSLSYLIRRDARRWVRSRREDESLLYRGDELRQAQGWASQHSSEIDQLIWEFLRASADLEEKRRRRVIFGLAIGLVVATMLASLAWWQRNVARRQTYVAQVRALAAQAQDELAGHPQRSLLLALEAFDRAAGTRSTSKPYIPAAEQALRDAMARMSGRGLSGPEADINALAFSPEGQWLAAGCDRYIGGGLGCEVGNVWLWDLTATDPAAKPLVLRDREGGGC
jgi:hypothetical protein